jgi:hypothetical protein
VDGQPCAWHSEGQGFESSRVHQILELRPRALLSQPVIEPVSFTAYRTADRPFTKGREEETMWRGSDGDYDPVDVSELLSAALHRRPTR